MARLHIHPVGLFLIFFGLLVWVVALGGLAASTRFCVKNASKQATNKYSCADAFKQEWWTVWFQFLLLLVMLLTCFTNAFERARTIYLAYLTMVTVLLTSMATKFISNSFSANSINLKDYKADANNAAAAGSVLLCITNFALIIFVGLGRDAPQSGGAPVPLSALGGSSAPEVKYQPSNF